MNSIQIAVEDCTADQLIILGKEGFRISGVGHGVVFFSPQKRLASQPEAPSEPKEEPQKLA